MRRYRQDRRLGAVFLPRPFPLSVCAPRGLFYGGAMRYTIFKHGKYSDYTPAPEGEAFDFLGFVSSGSDHEYTVFPGFCDVHVHFREPGFSYKETIKTGAAAAAHGGYTAVCTMPNLSPVPDTAEHLAPELSAIGENAACGSPVAVYPYGAITMGELGRELSDMESLAGKVVAFSDDGRGVQSEDMMRRAMIKARSCGKLIAAHCEAAELLHGGCIHDGEYARAHGHRGISSESEWREVERDIRLSEETGCALHICHISTKESVSLIRRAKARGVDVTCEVGPHYLLMSDADLREDGRFKMNPPLRSEEDREALVSGLIDGTIDMIATDHAPHSEEEKSRGLAGSAFGIVGLETAFPALYTGLVKPGVITLERLVALMAENPRKRFGIPYDRSEYTVWELDAEEIVDPGRFLSLGRATPFAGMKLSGKCVLTSSHGASARFTE